MGIPAPLAKILLLEHNYQPISGQILSLGRQTILFNEKTMYKMLSDCNIIPRKVSLDIDVATVEAKQSPHEKYITDNSFYSAFTEASYNVMDVTDYEGATIIHDLCVPPPENLLNQFDFILNGSVLDNIFDPAAALRNISRMLNPNGRVVHIEMASNLAFEYLIYSPDWFLDYYAINQFSDCRIYVCTFQDVKELKFGPWNIYEYHPRDGGNTACSLREIVTHHAVIVVIAKKKPESTYDRSPIQWCYRDEKMKKQHSDNYARLKKAYPLFATDRDQYDLQRVSGGFINLGNIKIA